MEKGLQMNAKEANAFFWRHRSETVKEIEEELAQRRQGAKKSSEGSSFGSS
jgi:hypothetical protein